MASEKQQPSAQGGKGKKEKKLRKREQRLEEQLLSARSALIDAGERLDRAKERINKRKERVERLEEQLAHLQRGQEKESAATTPTEVSPSIAEQAAQTPVSPQKEEPSTTTPFEAGSQISEQVAEAPVPPQEEEVAMPGEVSPAEQAQPEVAVASVAPTVSQNVQQEHTATPSCSQTPAAEETDEAIESAKIAREAAHAAEEAAREAIERVYNLMERLEEVGNSRHLTDELAQLQVEADSAKQQALIAEQQARQVEHEAGLTPTPDSEDALQAVTSVENDAPQEHMLDQADPVSSSQPAPEEEVQVSPSNADEQDVVPASALLSREERFSEALVASGEHPMPEALLPASMTRREQTPEHAPTIEDIEEEEMSVEAVTALIIADAAAVAAAQAEALAESYSSRTRAARLNAQQADEAVLQIRQALESGALSDDEAASALLDAERQATHAHAALADAEAAEEHARRNAMDAEAEAEVAEGMAFAADERSEYVEVQDYAHSQPTMQASDLAECQDEDDEVVSPGLSTARSDVSNAS